jgi:hypothetical protein
LHLITLNHTNTLGRTTLKKKSARRRDLYLTKQQSQKTDIHAPGGIRTCNPSKRAAADPRLRPRGQRVGPSNPDPPICTVKNSDKTWIHILVSYKSKLPDENRYLQSVITTAIRIARHPRPIAVLYKQSC